MNMKRSFIYLISFLSLLTSCIYGDKTNDDAKLKPLINLEKNSSTTSYRSSNSFIHGYDPYYSDSIIIVNDKSLIDSIVRNVIISNGYLVSSFEEFTLLKKGEVNERGDTYLGGLVSSDIYRIHLFITEFSDRYELTAYCDRKHNNEEYNNWSYKRSISDETPFTFSAREMDKHRADVIVDSILTEHNITSKNLVYKTYYSSEDLNTKEKYRLKELIFMKDVARYVLVYQMKDGRYFIEYRNRNDK